MRTLAILALLLTPPALADGPDLVSVAGLVLDAATGEAIPDATVTVELYGGRNLSPIIGRIAPGRFDHHWRNVPASVALWAMPDIASS